MQHLVFFQHGDYGAAWQRFAQGQPETYRDQRNSVDFVADLARRFHVTVVSIGPRAHREELAPGLVSLGIEMETAFSPAALLRLMAGLKPDLLICRTPHPVLLFWARLRGLPCLPVFADTFSRRGWKARIGLALLAQALKGRAMPCVANHSRNASLSLESVLGLPASRILPWDHPPLPAHPEPKPQAAAGSLRLFYAGPLDESKGVGDAMRALAILAGRGLQVGMDFAGGGDPAPWAALAEGLGIADRVQLLGRIPHDEVQARMRAADAVLVPSRHDYAEGLPNTIYETLAARGVLVVSDHPAFAGRLRDGRDALVFRAADPAHLAERLAGLAADPALGHRLSVDAPRALERLYYGILWTRLIQLFLDDPADATAWVARHSLARLRADEAAGETP